MFTMQVKLNPSLTISSCTDSILGLTAQPSNKGESIARDEDYRPIMVQENQRFATRIECPEVSDGPIEVTLDHTSIVTTTNHLIPL